MIKLLTFIGLLLSAFSVQAFDEVKGRFLEPLLKIENFLELEPSLLEEPNLARTKKARFELFRLQGLARMYEADFGADFKDLRNTVKAFEDAIGQYAFALETFEEASKRGLSSNVVERLERKAKKATKDFQKYLVEKDWSGSRTTNIHRIQNFIGEVDFGDTKTDRDYLVRQTLGLVQKIQRTEYDMQLLEEGVHEFRRQIRWISIYLLSVPDVFAYPEGLGCQVGEDFSMMENAGLAQNKYTQLPEVNMDWAGEKTCFVSKCAAYTLAAYIEEIGNLKDSGQLEEISNEEAREEELHEILNHAAGLYSDFHNRNVLGFLKEQLSSCL